MPHCSLSNIFPLYREHGQFITLYPCDNWTVALCLIDITEQTQGGSLMFTQLRME